jgi:hypothetical protein
MGGTLPKTGERETASKHKAAFNEVKFAEVAGLGEHRDNIGKAHFRGASGEEGGRFTHLSSSRPAGSRRRVLF